MNSQIPTRVLIKKSYSLTVQSLKKNHLLFIPFIIFAIFELIALTLIYLTPRMPFLILFGPPIRTFWNERFLHYPFNFLLLPKLTSLARMGLAIILGSLMTGMAVTIVLNIYYNKKITFKNAFKFALKKYANLFTLVLIFVALFYFFGKILTIGLVKYFLSGHKTLLFIRAQIWMGPLLTIINFILAILIQSVFVYAVPVLMIESEKLLKSIAKSFILFKNLFIPTLVLVGLPLCLNIPIVVLNYNTAFLINKICPEFIMFVSILSIILNSLIIDPIVTISTTFLYLMHKEK